MSQIKIVENNKQRKQLNKAVNTTASVACEWAGALKQVILPIWPTIKKESLDGPTDGPTN